MGLNVVRLLLWPVDPAVIWSPVPVGCTGCNRFARVVLDGPHRCSQVGHVSGGVARAEGVLTLSARVHFGHVAGCFVWERSVVLDSSFPPAIPFFFLLGGVSWGQPLGLVFWVALAGYGFSRLTGG